MLPVFLQKACLNGHRPDYSFQNSYVKAESEKEVDKLFLFSPVVSDLHIDNRNNSIGGSGEMFVMGDGDHRMVLPLGKVAQDGLHIGARPRIEIAGGLVGVDQQRIVGKADQAANDAEYNNRPCGRNRRRRIRGFHLGVGTHNQGR